jgi:hypothetical protein
MDYGGGGWSSSAPSYEGTVPIGNIEISASVNIVFEIDPSFLSNFNSNKAVVSNVIEECDIQQALLP